MITTTNTMPTNNHCGTCTCTCLGGACDYWHVESDEEEQITYITHYSSEVYWAANQDEHLYSENYLRKLHNRCRAQKILRTRQVLTPKLDFKPKKLRKNNVQMHCNRW